MAKKTTQPQDESAFGPEDEVKGDIFKFEKVGDTVEGILLDARTIKSPITGENLKMYDIMQADGSTKSVFGRPVVDQKMKVAKLGQLVKMVFASQGKPKAKGMSGFKLIKIYIKNAPMTDSDEIDADKAVE